MRSIVIKIIIDDREMQGGYEIILKDDHGPRSGKGLSKDFE